MTRTTLRLFCVAAAVFAILSHICVLPTHAHVTNDPPPVAEHDTGDARDSGESLHAASCEAVVSQSGTRPAFVCALAVRPPGPWAALRNERPGPIADHAPSESPPLFLLHASLLI